MGQIRTILNNKGLFEMRFINFPDLRTKLGNRSRSACYCDLAEGRLPMPVKLGGRLYWDEAALEHHLRAMAEQDAA